MRNLFRTGSLDDIVWTNSPDVYYLADKNIATNLTPYIEASEEAGVFRLEEDFYQEFFDVAAVDGKQYAIPRSADSVVTFVNKDILKKAGVDLDPETTLVKDGWSWADFMSVCAQVRTYLDNNGMSDYYVCDANLTAWLSTSYPVLRSYGRGYAGRIRAKAATHSPETRNACNGTARWWISSYIVDTSKESASSFESGTSTFLFQSASISLFANRPALKGKIDLVSFPLIQEKNTPKIGSGIAGYSINVNAKNKDLCWAFLSHMLSYDGQQAMAPTAEPRLHPGGISPIIRPPTGARDTRTSTWAPTSTAANIRSGRIISPASTLLTRATSTARSKRCSTMPAICPKRLRTRSLPA